MNTKKAILLMLVFTLLIGVVGCGGAGKTEETGQAEIEKTEEEQTEEKKEPSKEKIVIGTKPAFAEALESIFPELEARGYKAELKLINDTVQLNEAVEDGSVDVNFFQHDTFMNQFNDSRDAHLARVEEPLYEQVVGLYSRKYNSIDELPEGSTVAIQNDAVNRDRALKMLSDQDLLSLDPEAGKDGSVYNITDIVENPKNINFKEVAGETLVRALDDADAAILQGLYAKQADFSPEDALAQYDREDNINYAIVLVAKEGNETLDWAKAVHECLQTKAAVDKIAETTNGCWIPLFEIKN